MSNTYETKSSKAASISGDMQEQVLQNSLMSGFQKLHNDIAAAKIRGDMERIVVEAPDDVLAKIVNIEEITEKVPYINYQGAFITKLGWTDKVEASLDPTVRVDGYVNQITGQ